MIRRLTRHDAYLRWVYEPLGRVLVRVFRRRCRTCHLTVTLMPDLKRQAHEFLQAAQKIPGWGRVNHPFSFVVHGNVAELDTPWVVPSKEFPVMFWGRDAGQSAYIGMHYPAHLYDRGRQVPYRERWEGPGTIGPVTGLPPSAQNLPSQQANRSAASIPSAHEIDSGSGRRWSHHSDWSAEHEREVRRSIEIVGVGDFLVRQGVSLETPPSILSREKRTTGRYDPGTRQLLVSNSRPEGSFGQVFQFRRLSMVSEGARDWTEAMQRTAVHEIGHAIRKSGPGQTRRFTDLLHSSYDDHLATGAFASIRASIDPGEFFAETLVAYIYHAAVLKDFDPGGYEMIETILRWIR